MLVTLPENTTYSTASQDIEKNKRFGISDRLNIATWNVKGFGTKESELEEILKARNVHIAIITETWKKLKGTKDLNHYVMIYSGVPQNKRAQSGVAILVDSKWKSKIEFYTYVDERILTIRLRIGRGHLTIIGVYAPANAKKEEIEMFYDTLQKVVQNVNKNDSLIISGDFNARIGNSPIPDIVGIFGEDVINSKGQELRQFATNNHLKITNTFFRKRDINKYTWSERGLRSIIDYVLINDKLRPQLQDVHVYRGCDINSDHHLVMARFALWTKWKNSKVKERPLQEDVYKIYLLNQESIRNLYQQRLNQYILNTPTDSILEAEWQNIKNCIEKAANEVLGKKKKLRSRKGLRIWNRNIEEAIKEKQEAYLQWLQQKTDLAKEKYKEKRNKAKTIVREAHQQSWNKFISEIENDIHGNQTFSYKVLKHLNKSEKDVARINVIQQDVWIQHYKELWFQENEDNVVTENENVEVIDVDPITKEELDEVFKETKNRKSTGPDGINMELLKYGGILLHFRLLHLINQCWRNCKIPEAWTTAEIISLFKKGDRNNCENYRGISLLNSIYKVYAKIINKRLKVISENLLSEEQCGFRTGRSTSDNVFILQQLFEKRREFNLQTHVAFVDFVKAFDRVNRSLLWTIMKDGGYPQHLINTIKSLYCNSKIIINTGRNKTQEIFINRGVRQGCTLSPTLFNIYINDLIQKWKILVNPGIKVNFNTSVNILLYADDVVIIQNNEDDLQRSLYYLNIISQEYDFIISTEKTKILAFWGKSQIRSKIILEGRSLEQVENFNYLGCDINTRNTSEDDVNKKVSKFQMMCGTIHRTLKNKTRKDTRIKFYKTMATPLLLYGSETWVNTKRIQNKIQSAEMTFLRRTKGCTRSDRFRNEDIREELHIFSMNGRIKEHRDRWFQHINRMEDTRLPKLLLNYKATGRRDVGRPKGRWRDKL